MTALEVQLIVSVATILCSGVISAIVTHRLASSRAERDFRRKKLEELFVAVSRYCTRLTTANLMWPRVMRGELDYNQGLDIQIQNHTEKDYSHETVTMLINIYFPQLRPAFEAVLHRRDEINRIQSAFKATYQRGASCESFVQPFSQQLALIDDDEKKLTDQLFSISSKLK